MKLHLPKLLRNALLACFAMTATQAAYSLTVLDNYVVKDASASFTLNDVEYTVTDGLGTITGLDSNSITYTFVLNTAAMNAAESMDEIMYGQTTLGNKWGFRMYDGDDDGELEVVSLWNDGMHQATSYYREVADITNPVVTATLQQSQPGARLYLGTTADGTPYFQKDDLLTSNGGNFNSAVFSTSLVSGLVFSEEGKTTLVNADGSWVRTYDTSKIKLNGVADTAVDATLFSSNARHQINGGAQGNGATLSANGGDIIVGGEAQLYFQTWGQGDVTVSNDLYIGSSTNGNVPTMGVVHIGNDSDATTNFNGAVYVIENSSIISCGGASNDSRIGAVNFNNAVSGQYDLKVGGCNYTFKDSVTLKGLTLAVANWQGNNGASGNMTFESLVDVHRLDVKSGVTVDFTETSTLKIHGTASNSGIINLQGDLEVCDLGGAGYSPYGDSFAYYKTGTDTTPNSNNNGYAASNSVVLVTGTINGVDADSVTGEGLLSSSYVEGVGLVGTTENAVIDKSVFYVNTGTVIAGEDGYTDLSAPLFEVAAGAVLDMKGVYFTGKEIALGEGAILRNSGTGHNGNYDLIQSISLTGDATVEAGNNIGLKRAGSAATQLHLGGNTLSITGGNRLFMVNTDVDGGGVVKVGGILQVGMEVDSGHNKSVRARGTDFVLDGGTITFCRAENSLLVHSLSGTGTVNGAGYLDFTGNGVYTIDATNIDLRIGGIKSTEGTPTINILGSVESGGSLYARKADITFGDGKSEALASFTRIEMGDADGNTSGANTITISGNYTVAVTGNDNNGGNYKGCSLLIGEWMQVTTLEVQGELLAKAATLLLGDTGGVVNVSEGGLVAVNGVARAKNNEKNPGFTLNLYDGGSFVVGASGIEDMSGTGTHVLNMKGGTIGISAAEVTIAETLNLAGQTTSFIDTTLYSFSDDGTSITKGSNGGTMTISKAVAGAGTLVKQGAGTLKITGGTADGFRGAFNVQSGTLELGGTVNVGGTIVNQGGSLTFNGATVNVNNTELLEKIEGGTYKDFSGQTGQNGFFSGQAYVVKGDYSKVGNFTLQLNGKTLTNYGTTGGITVTVDDKDTYCVNQGTVTLTKTEKVAAFHIASEGILVYQAGDFTDDVITGSGVYDIGSNFETANRTGLTNADAWTGTVRISNATVGGNNFSFNNYGNVNSSLELVGVSGWLGENSNMAARLLLGKDTKAGLNGINITTGSDWTHFFSGGVAGEGDFLVSNSGGGSPTYVFKGDMSGWTGAFRVDNASADKNITMKVENTGGVTNVNASVECTNGSLTLDVAGSKGKAVFNKAVNATTLKINGHGEFTKDVTLTGDLKLTSDINNHVVFHGTNNTANVVDLSNGGNAAGKVELAKGASLTSASTLWMNAGASISLQETATFNWDRTKVIGKAGGASAIKASTNAAQWMNMEGLQILNADYELNWDSEKHVAALLNNSRIINAGDGLVKVTNSANTLAGVEAKQGNVLVQNATTGSVVGLGAIAAADDLSISAKMESAKVSAITLGARATFSTTGALTVADGSALSLGADAGISLDGALTLGSGLAITVSDVTKDTILFSGVASIATSLDDITAYVSSINGLTDLSDYTLELDGTNLVLVVDKGKIVNWSASNSIWEDGAQFGATTEDIDKFANGDAVVFGTLEANEEVTIKGEIHALSMDVAAGAGKTYTFSAAANGGTLTVPSLSITSGKAVFGANTIQLDSLAAVTVGQTGELDVSAYGLGAFSKLVTKTTGDGTVKIGGYANDAGEPGAMVDLTAIEGTTLNLNANYVVSGNMALDGGNTAETVAVKKGLNVGTLRIQNGTTVEVDGNLEAVTIHMGQGGAKGDGTLGHLVLKDGGSLSVGTFIKCDKQDANDNTFTMNGGTLKMTATNTITDIATTITGGTLVADTFSWGIKGATIGGWDAVNNAPKVTISGTQTITLTNATLTSTLKNTGNLNLAGTINISNTEAAAFQTTKNGADWFSTTGDANGNGFRFATLDYTIATGTGTVTTADGLKWSLNGTELTIAQYKLNLNTATENSTDNVTTISIMGQRQDTLYWVNTGTVNYGGTDGAVMTGATGIALNGGTIQLNTTLQSDWDIERKGTTGTASVGTINLNGTGVTLTAAQVTGTGSATLTGNGVYDLGTVTNLGTAITEQNALKVSFGDTWTGTVKLGGTVENIILNDLGRNGSTVELSGVSGKLSNDTESALNFTRNVLLTNGGFTFTNHAKATYTFSGAVTGDGNLSVMSEGTDALGLKLTGDLSAWKGDFVVGQHTTSSNTPVVKVEFTGGGKLFAADSKSSIAMNRAGTLNVTIGNTTKATTMNGDISKVADATLNLTTEGEVTMVGTLADGIGLTNNGKLELTQDTASLASLAGTGSVTAKSLTLTGDDNAISSLTLSTGLTLGVAAAGDDAGVVSSLEVTTLTVDNTNKMGLVTINNLNAATRTTPAILKAGSLAGSLTFAFDDALLETMVGATDTKSLVLMEITGGKADDTKLLLKAFGESTDAATSQISQDQRYTYALVWNPATKQLKLEAQLCGVYWNGTNAPDDPALWTENSSWATSAGEPVPVGGAPSDTVAAVISGGDNTIFVKGAADTLSLTVDVWRAFRESYDLQSYNGSGFFTPDASVEDKLTIEKNLVVNAGALNVKVDTEVKGDLVVKSNGRFFNHDGDKREDEATSLQVKGNLDNAGTLFKNHMGATLTVEGNATNSGTLANGTALTGQETTAGSGDAIITIAGQLTNTGAITNGEAGKLTIGSITGYDPEGSDIVNTGVITNAGTLAAARDMANSGVYTQTDGSLYVGGNLTNTGVASEENPAAGMNITGGKVTVGTMTNNGTLNLSHASLELNGYSYTAAPGPVSTLKPIVQAAELVNTGTMNITNGAQVKVNTITVGKQTAVGTVTNTGEIKVTDGSLTTSTMDNDGTLTIGGAKDAEGNVLASVKVTGGLDNTAGNIVIGSAATETDKATYGSLSVGGNLTHAGNGNIVVNSGSSLDVKGDLAANGMTLDFDGVVTVGGNAVVNNLTNDGTFTADNATIGKLTNNGTLSVGEVGAGGNLIGGKLTITTLTGTGAVNVGKDGSLTITDAAAFSGKLNNQGKLELKGATLIADQAKGATAGNITTEIVTVKSTATGYNRGSYVMGDIKTDALVIEDIDAAGTAARLDMNSLAAKTTDGVVSITISNDDMAAVVAAGKGSYDLISVGSVLSGLNLTNNDDLTTAYMQALLAKGLNMELRPSEAAATAAVAAAVKTVVKLNVREQTADESIWNFDGAHNTTEAGLIVLKDGKLASNVVLDKVQTVKVTDSQSLDLTGDISKVTLNGLTAVNADSSVAQKLTITGDAGDTATVTTAASGYAGTVVLDKVTGNVSGELDTVKLTNKAVANLAVSDTDVEALEAGLTLNGSMKGGELSISKADGVKGTLKIDGTDLNIAYDDKGALSMSIAKVPTTGHVLVNMDKITGEAGDIFIGKDGEASKLMEKYFTNVRFEDKKGVVADRNTVYYTSKLTDSASSDNGKAGLAMADEALLIVNPQNTSPTGDLAEVLKRLDAYVTSGNKADADELGASLAGASTAVLGMAAMGDVDRQLRAIRNRTTTMGVDQSVVNADMPYFNAWINAEGDSREMGEDETLGGYKLNSYGGTVGFDVDIEPTFTAGMALTAMYGDLDTTGADKATGNLDSYYVSAFARYCGSAWTHTFVGTIGMSDISLDRTVGTAQVQGETDAMSFGLMYEVGRVYAMDEDGTTCLQPVFNVTWKHTTVDAYTEKGGDVALKVDEQSLNTITFGLGARLQTVVGESMYNRTSIFECRLLAKADAGDTEGTSKVALGSLSSHEVKSNEMGAVGIELGAGLTIPLGDEGSSIFMDASAEIRADYTDVNGTVGYRVNF